MGIEALGMLTQANWRDPILINTIGHTAGLLLFAFIITLFLRDRRAHGIRETKLSIVAAALALAWNVGSLVAVGVTDQSTNFMAVVMAAAFSVLSLLPAVLLQIALKGEFAVITKAGYAVSMLAVLLHVSELFTSGSSPHQAALLLVAAGFAVLTGIALFVKRQSRSEWLSLVCLLLFVSSFPHFGYQHLRSPWAAEITWHHIGIPVAIIVLLQDYRFLLLDTFVRFLMNSILAAAYLAAVLFLNEKLHLWNRVASNPVLGGIVTVALCLSLILFAHCRNLLQRWIGRVIFRRQNLDDCIRKISQLPGKTYTEDELLNSAARAVAAHLGAEQFAVIADHGSGGLINQPAMVFGTQLSWAEAQIPLRFSVGESKFLLTGPRRGHQRYLSEDLEDMRRLGSVIVEQVERFRSEELRRLATQAELRALQAQMNPHFLFNAFNTLYGTIDRESFEARRLVLNLTDIFRYLLQSDRSFIPLSEELRIIRAYLEIEALRLGDRLETVLDVEESALSVIIPILSVQPLVENAVKHGVAPRMGRGRVVLRVRNDDGILRVIVQDSGSGFAFKQESGDNGGGVGLANVRRRLHLSYGAAAILEVDSSELGSTVTLAIPCTSTFQYEKQEVEVG